MHASNGFAENILLDGSATQSSPAKGSRSAREPRQTASSDLAAWKSTNNKAFTIGCPKIKLSQARQPMLYESAPEWHLSPSLSDWRTAYSLQSP
jgi:hypothetical protein